MAQRNFPLRLSVLSFAVTGRHPTALKFILYIFLYYLFSIIWEIQLHGPIHCTLLQSILDLNV